MAEDDDAERQREGPLGRRGGQGFGLLLVIRLFLLDGGVGGDRVLLVAALNPVEDGHDAKVGGQNHGAGQVGADADEALLVHEQVEEEALVQVLEQVVETAERALNNAAHGHLVLPALAKRVEGDGVDMVRDEAAVGARGVAQALLEHAAEHGLEAGLVLVTALEVPHLLEANGDTHLALGDVADGVDEIEVGELAVDAVVGNVEVLEAVLLGVVESNGALERAALERQAGDAGGVVGVVVGVDPGLGPGAGVRRHNKDDILGPQRPALEVAGERQQERNSHAVEVALDVAPGRDEDDGLGGIATGCLQNGVDVLARILGAGRLVRVVLATDLEAEGPEDVFEVIVDSGALSDCFCLMTQRVGPTYSMFVLFSRAFVSCLYPRKMCWSLPEKYACTWPGSKAFSDMYVRREYSLRGSMKSHATPAMMHSSERYGGSLRTRGSRRSESAVAATDVRLGA